MNSRHSVDRVLDGLRDEYFHLLGSQPRRFGLYADLRRSKLREDVVLRPHHRQRAVAEEHEGERYNDAAKAHSKPDDCALQAAVGGQRIAWCRHQSVSPPTWICDLNSSDKSSWALFMTTCGRGSGKAPAGTTKPPSLPLGISVGISRRVKESSPTRT